MPSASPIAIGSSRFRSYPASTKAYGNLTPALASGCRAACCVLGLGVTGAAFNIHGSMQSTMLVLVPRERFQ